MFPSTEALQTEGRTDLLGYAGQQVTTGHEAEAYASYIGHHLDGIADGATYADLGAPERAAKAEVTAAKESGASEAAVANRNGSTGRRASAEPGLRSRFISSPTPTWITAAATSHGTSRWV